MDQKRTDKLFEAMLDAIPSPVLLVDEDVNIIAANAAANSFIGVDAKTILRKRGGDVMGCLHSTKTSKGCGHAEMCRQCVIRNSVERTFMGKKVVRAQTKMDIQKDGKTTHAFILVTTSPIALDGVDYCLLIMEDFSELVKLKSLLPICAYCKKVRNDSNYWERVESFLGDRLDLTFSHGICPDCFKEQMAELQEKHKKS